MNQYNKLAVASRVTPSPPYGAGSRYVCAGALPYGRVRALSAWARARACGMGRMGCLGYPCGKYPYSFSPYVLGLLIRLYPCY